MGCCTWIVVIPLLLFLLKKLVGKWKAYKLEQMLDRWSQPNTPKDVVILHSMKRGKTVPTVSPFALKVETYFRMTGVKYELETSDKIGPKSKFPWISINGEHVSDSEFIIEFISKKFSKNLSKNVDEKVRTAAMLARIVLEEHFFWGMATERFISDRSHHFDLSNLIEIPSFLLSALRAFAKYEMGRRLKAQGTGLHSESEVIQLMTKNLRAISELLGDKKFICGEEPCEEDAGIFGILAQVLFSLPDSPYERLLKGELKNLEAYCHRIKKQYWPDWNEVVRK